MAGDLKSHVEEHHKDAALAKKKVSMDDLVWLSYNLVVYRNLMEPTDSPECHSFLPAGIPLTWVDKEDISDISDPCWPEGEERPI